LPGDGVSGASDFALAFAGVAVSYISFFSFLEAS